MHKTLVQAIRTLQSDPKVLKNKWFPLLLNTLATEWGNFCLIYNGGNDRSYNLNQSGVTIKAIMETCWRLAAGRHITQRSKEEKMNWEDLIADIEDISEIVDFELTFNIIKVDPHTPLVGYYGYKHEYKIKK